MGCGACSTGWAGQMLHRLGRADAPKQREWEAPLQAHFWELMFDVEALEKRTG